MNTLAAVIRLQDCSTNSRRAFVGKAETAHGVAAGQIRKYVATGRNWAKIRQLLKDEGVIGYSRVHPTLVDAFINVPLLRPTKLVPVTDLGYTDATVPWEVLDGWLARVDRIAGGTTTK